MMALKVTQGHGLTEAGIKAFGDTDWTKWQTTTTQGILRMLPCYEEILTEKTRSWSCQNSVLDFNSSSGSSASPSVLLDITDDDPHDPPTVQKEVLPPGIVICLFTYQEMSVQAGLFLCDFFLRGFALMQFENV
jgi:hypothetical protein